MALINDFILMLWTIMVPIVFILYIIILQTARETKSEIRKKFFKVMKEGLKTESMVTIDDVVNIYKGIAGLSSEDLNYRYGLSNLLREFLVDLISKSKGIMDDSLDDDVIRDWKQKISDFIKENETISPYANLPAAERNTLSDISTFLEKNDKGSVKRKTQELAGMIQARDNDLNRIRNINRWTKILSIIGFILTIVFGILAWVR